MLIELNEVYGDFRVVAVSDRPRGRMGFFYSCECNSCGTKAVRSQSTLAMARCRACRSRRVRAAKGKVIQKKVEGRRMSAKKKRILIERSKELHQMAINAVKSSTEYAMGMVGFREAVLAAKEQMEPSWSEVYEAIDKNGAMSLCEVGEMMNLSGERVRQIEVRALRKLKVALMNDGVDVMDVLSYIASKPAPEDSYGRGARVRMSNGPATTTTNRASVITREKALTIREVHANGGLLEDIALEFHVSVAAIRAIVGSQL